jgi:chromosome segregation ATPase
VTVLTLVFGGLLFFVRRYISTNDTHHQKVENKLKEIDDTLEDHRDRMSNAMVAIDRSATEIKQSALNFQKEINKEITTVHKSVSEVVADVRVINRAVTDLQSTIIKHQESLSLGAKALAKQREEIIGIRTTITKISETMVLIGQRKGDRG